jgi:short-subunit dehydrogenase
MRRVLVLGATSAIAQHAARRFAADGDALFLVGRRGDRLATIADDLRVRGASRIETRACDLDRLEVHGELVALAEESLGGLDIALLAHGTLPDQKACEADFAKAHAALLNNFLSPTSLLTHLANVFERRRAGCIAVITSVAGDRARGSNYVYGTAKGAVTLFLQGLRSRLFEAGVAVVTIKPGWVDTPMTAHMKKNPLFASAASVGGGVYRAIVARRDVVHLPWFWRGIMWVFNSVPEALFKRLKL